MLDVKIATALRKVIQNSNIRKKVHLEEQEAQQDERFLRGRQIAFMIYEYFWVTGTHETILEFSDLMGVTVRADGRSGFLYDMGRSPIVNP